MNPKSIWVSQAILPLNLNSATEEVLLTIYHFTDYLTFSTDAPAGQMQVCYFPELYYLIH